ncbi:hypothetical protein EVAR_54937_1 [Eumeta japonica]|uniref:Uncharacterized protein n=1 Tax=Eumeta variegata TaxID=151549 RepID=A0A4C1YCX1_EUMVA|nr:hypothetical protein EVAR_54937_1 [Eumeta japonica]
MREQMAPERSHPQASKRRTPKHMTNGLWPDLPYGFLGFSPGPRGFKRPPAKSSQSKIDDMLKNRNRKASSPHVLQDEMGGPTAQELETRLTLIGFSVNAGGVIFRSDLSPSTSPP